MCTPPLSNLHLPPRIRVASLAARVFESRRVAPLHICTTHARPGRLDATALNLEKEG